MPKVTEAHREARRDEILDAAARCFSAKGFARTSMIDIIGEAGASAGAIYGHFAGKRELFLAVAERLIAGRAAMLQQRRADGPALAPAEILTALMRSFDADPETSRLLVHLWGEAMLDTEIRGATDQILAMLRRAIGGALAEWFREHPDASGRSAEASAQRLLPLMLGMGQGFLLQRQLFATFDQDGYLELVAEALLPR